MKNQLPPLPPSDFLFLSFFFISNPPLAHTRLYLRPPFQPFLLAAAMLFPTYLTEPDPLFVDNSFMKLSIGNLPNNSWRLWMPWLYSLVFYAFLLRLVWCEWTIFAKLR